MSSNELSDIFRTVASLASKGERFALATVLNAQGPTPCRAGARAIVLDDSRVLGTVGGGVVEAEAVRRAGEAIESQRPGTFDFNLAGESADGTAPVCGGMMSILVDPTAAAQHDVYARAATALQQRKRGVLVTEMASTPGGVIVQVEYLAEEAVPDSGEHARGSIARSVLLRQQPTLATIESDPQEATRLFVEPVIPQPCLLILGAGHVGRAVANLAVQTGFEVVVIDDRPDYAVADRFHERVRVRCGSIGDETSDFPFAADTYVVIVTRNHQLDAEALAACLAQDVAYLGMIGSRRKVAVLKTQFLETGKATAGQLENLYAPIGLDIGADTVPEIAVSIVAQLVNVRRRGSAPRIEARP